MFDEIKELKSLLDEGLITQEDYDRKKAELLSCGANAGESEVKECGKGNKPTASKIAAKMPNGSNKVKISLIVLIVIAAITFVLGVSNLGTAYDKIDNYYSSETYPSLNKNAYVGGDAYNYIINGTYFTGYVVQGMGYLLISTMSALSGLFLFLHQRPSGENETDGESKSPEQNGTLDSAEMNGVEISADKPGETAGLKAAGRSEEVAGNA